MLKPLFDFIVIKPLDRVQSTVIEVVSHEKHCRGLVIACGPGKRAKNGGRKPMDAKPGDTVIFGDGNFDFYPRHYEPDGTLYRIIQQGDICGIVEP